MSSLCTQFRLSLDDLNDRSIFINWSFQERKRIFRRVLSQMKLTELARLLPYDLPTLSEIKAGSVKPSGFVYLSLYNILKLKPSLLNLKISSRNHGSVKLVSPYISPELLGLLHSDGILKKNKQHGISCFFCNKNKNLVNHFKRLLGYSFNSKFFEFRDGRDKTYYVYPPSIIGRLLIKRFGEKKNHSPPLLSDEEIPPYLRGLFGGDGTILLQNSKNALRPRIRISMQHREFAQEVLKLLGRIRIYSRLQYESSNGNSWWNIGVARKESVLFFINKIGSAHPKKRRRMQLVKGEIKSPLANSPNISSVLPLICQ